MHKLMFGTALCVGLGLQLSADLAQAKAGDPSPQRSVCRLASAVPPLKLLSAPVLAEYGVGVPAGRISRRANYTPVPSATAREQASYAVLLERQSKPTNLMVGVGF
jgi:hypothetical protein